MAVSANQVTSLYQSLLGRAPDAGGLSYYQGYASPAAITASIKGSAEYKGKNSGSGSSLFGSNAPSAQTTTDQNALNTFLTNSNNGTQALLDKQNQEQQGFFNQYQTAVNNQTKLPDLYTQLTTQAGIPDITNQLQTYKDQIYRTKDLLDALPTDLQSRQQGTNTTQAQLDRSITAESNPLQTTLSKLGTGMQPLTDQLTSAQNQVSTMMPLYQQQQQAELQPLITQINSLSDKYARQITGFTTDSKNQLDSLMATLARDQTLDDQQWTAAQTLAAQEASYKQAMATAKISAGSNAGLYLGGNIPTTAPAGASTPTVRQLPTIANNTLGVSQSIPASLGVNLGGGGSSMSNMLQGYSGGLQ